MTVMSNNSSTALINCMSYVFLDRSAKCVFFIEIHNFHSIVIDFIESTARGMQ